MVRDIILQHISIYAREAMFIASYHCYSFIHFTNFRIYRMVRNNKLKHINIYDTYRFISL